MNYQICRDKASSAVLPMTNTNGSVERSSGFYIGGLHAPGYKRGRDQFLAHEVKRANRSFFMVHHIAFLH